MTGSPDNPTAVGRHTCIIRSACSPKTRIKFKVIGGEPKDWLICVGATRGPAENFLAYSGFQLLMPSTGNTFDAGHRCKK